MKQPLDPQLGLRRFSPSQAATLYAIFASVWIFASGLLLTFDVAGPVWQGRFEIGKGLLFVLVTSSLLYLLLRQWGEPLPRPITKEDLRPDRLRWRMLSLIVLAAMVPLTGLVVVKIHGPQIEREAFANLEAVAELRASQIESWLDERRNDGRVIMSSPDIVRLVVALQHGGGSRVQEELSDRLVSAVDPVQYDVVMLVDPQGKTLLSFGDHDQLAAQTTETIALALVGGLPQYSEFFADPEGHRHLDLVVPLFVFEVGARQPLGALIMRVSPEKFLFPSLKRWPTASPSGETLLVRRDSDSVLFLNELRHAQGGNLFLRLPLDRHDLPEAAAVREARSGVRQGMDYRGVAVFAAYCPVAHTEWAVVAKLDRDEVLAPLRGLAFWVSLVALLAIATVGGVMLILLRQRGRNQQLELQAQADRLLRQFYDLPFIGIAISSPTTKRWLKFNDRLCEILGYSREEMLATSWAEMTHPDDLAANVAALERVMSGESGGYILDKRFIHKDGRIVHTTLDARCVRKADGSPEYIFATVQDITERKLAEAKIQRLTQMYAALSECNQAIVRCASQEELFPQICRSAVELGGMKMAWVGLVDTDTLRVCPVASFGDETDCLRDLRVSADSESPFGRGVTGTSIREHRPVWAQDFLNDPITAPWHERGECAGWRAAAALPLIRNGVVIGALTLCASETNAFDEAVRNLLTKMAQDISFALNAFDMEADRQRIQVALRESESRFRDLYEKAPLAYQSLDVEGKILEVNKAWLNLLGRTRDEVIGKFIGDFMSDVSIKTLAHEFPKFQIKGSVDGPLFHFVHKDGSQRLLMVNGQIARDKEGGFLRTHCILTDLTERLQSAEQLKLAATVFEQSAEGIFITDASHNILMVNRAFSVITGYSAAEALGKNPRLMSSGRHDEQFFSALWDTVCSDGYWQGEIWNRRKDGEVYPELVSISQVLDVDGTVSHFVALFSDISEHKESQAHIQRLAHYDALTGLPNRSLLADRVGQAINRVERNNEPLALIFLDLDRFKNVNDSLGHRIGDELLIQVAERLKSALREEDTVSRLGGDEFILVLPGAEADGAAHVAEKVLKSVALPYFIEQHELAVTPSLGIAMYPADGATYEKLSMCADAAMYRAKQGGRNTFRFFTREMQERSDRTLQLENALRRVLELDQLQLHYQPQMSLDNGSVIGVEALLRWGHPEMGQVPPSDFIPVGEDSGLILPIGEWVLRTAVRQMKVWMDAGLSPMVMAVNLSAVQFRQANLPELVSQILDEFGLPPRCLELELTEGVAMDNPLSAIAVMNDLHERGIRMSIDDFGTGYSSLSYLKRFKVYKLKIDQTFVRDISTDPEDAAIVEAIIGLSRSLGLQTIAEGVETVEQLAFLRSKGCHEVQGYFFAKPMPAEQFEAYVRGYSPEL